MFPARVICLLQLWLGWDALSRSTAAADDAASTPMPLAALSTGAQQLLCAADMQSIMPTTQTIAVRSPSEDETEVIPSPYTVLPEGVRCPEGSSEAGRFCHNVERWPNGRYYISCEFRPQRTAARGKLDGRVRLQPRVQLKLRCPNGLICQRHVPVGANEASFSGAATAQETTPASEERPGDVAPNNQPDSEAAAAAASGSSSSSATTFPAMGSDAGSHLHKRRPATTTPAYGLIDCVPRGSIDWAPFRSSNAEHSRRERSRVRAMRRQRQPGGDARDAD